jgi:hypothetical protein
VLLLMERQTRRAEHGATHTACLRGGTRTTQPRHVLQDLMPTLPLSIFSEYSDVFSEKEARSAGVSALVSKSEDVSVLVGKARALLYDIAA